MKYFAEGRPRIFGHRGAAGLAPENTEPSFSLALAMGASHLELDVRGTKDGEVVVLHDATLDRTTDGRGAISACLLAEMAGLDAGFHFTSDGTRFPYRGRGIRIPTLRSVLENHPEAPVNIEIKQENPPIIAPVIETIVRLGACDRVLLAAGNDAVMKPLRKKAAGRMSTGMSTEEVLEFFDRFVRNEWSGYRPPGDAIQIPVQFQGIELVTEESVAAAHRLGLEVHVWTINDPVEVRRLLPLGVDGIMSDFPGMARAVVEGLDRSCSAGKAG